MSDAGMSRLGISMQCWAVCREVLCDARHRAMHPSIDISAPRPLGMGIEP